jgi:NAD(P)-dependent dehydrogenase (short-subunit alcohol dehydrogenase family)
MARAIVTGASRGLGLALARGLADGGWEVIVDARDADALAAAWTPPEAGVRVQPGDIRDGAHRRALVSGAAPLDALVLNAATLGPSPLPPLARTDPLALQEVLASNVTAQLALVQGALPVLRDGGVVCAITSDAAVEAYPGWGGYGASKAALEHLMRVFAVEEPRLRWYAVDPGDMRTRMHAEAFPGEDISDRPLPQTRVPGLVRLLRGELPSGRYAVERLPQAVEAWS